MMTLIQEWQFHPILLKFSILFNFAGQFAREAMNSVETCFHTYLVFLVTLNE